MSQTNIGSDGKILTLDTAALTTNRAVTVPDTAGVMVIDAATQTLTNKKVTPRISTIASPGTITPNTSTADLFIVSALANALTIAAPGDVSPTDGLKFMIRIKAAAAQTLTWNAIYLASGVAALPTTSVAGKTITCGFVYDATQVKWVLMAVDAVGY